MRSANRAKPFGMRCAMVALVLGLTAICALVISDFFSSKAGSGVQSPEENIQVFDTPSPDRVVDEVQGLPFRIAGVPSDAPVYQAEDISSAEKLSPSWEFGGDFSAIGSFPISEDEVFGSASKTPNDLASYYPAMISNDDVEAIGPVESYPYFEPRDGSSDGGHVVWLSATINDGYGSDINNWRLFSSDLDDGELRELASAAELNGTDETPSLPGEVVPTVNSSHAYYATAYKDGEAWTPVVIQCDANGDGRAEVIGAGYFPHATSDGVLYATDYVMSDEVNLGYSTLIERSGSTERDVLSVDSANSKWCISGIWACDSMRVVAFSNAVESDGCYLGIWGDDFKRPVAWVHVGSASIVGSIGGDRFVWGSGSQEAHAEMYLFDLDRPEELRMLGSAPGYSRPTISFDGKALLVPVYNGMQAVKFEVYGLK